MKTTTLKTADSIIEADLYSGPLKHGIVTAHGKAFNKETWHELAFRLQKLTTVISINFRGYGNSKGPGGLDENDIAGALPFFSRDLTGAADYLKDEMGVETVSLIGGSMGGGAAAQAAIDVPDLFDRLILLSPVPVEHPEKIKAGFVEVVASEDEPLMKTIQDQYEKIDCPKHLTVLDGDAHAQHLFKTKHNTLLIQIIEDHFRR